jgi:hypothetical protein
MTAAQAAQFLNKTGRLVTSDGWEVRVTVTDAKSVFGRTVFTVTDGKHVANVNAERITFGDI